MNLKTFIVAAVAALSMAATPALAADFTGPRVSVVGGYDNIQDREGVTYGVVAGVDAPVMSGVTVGVEATLEDSTADAGGLELSRDLGLNVRAGVKVLSNAQLFAKVGYASTRFEVAGTNAGVALEGLRYGAGVEYAFTDNLFATAEYRRSEYEDNIGGRDGILVGLGFRF